MNYEFANHMYDKAVDNVSYYADQVKVCKSNDIDWFIDELKYWREQAEYWREQAEYWREQAEYCERIMYDNEGAHAIMS